MSSNRDFPLWPIFSSSGSLHDCADSHCTESEMKKFKQHFNVNPSRFIIMEASLKQRCDSHGITYIPPNRSDSVEATLERKAGLNRKIATEKQRQRRSNRTPEDRETQNSKQRLYAKAARSNESVEEKGARRAKDRNTKKKARANETPEQKAARNEAQRESMRKTRENESPRKKIERSKKRSRAWRRKRKRESEDEANMRRMQNRKSKKAARANEPTGEYVEIVYIDISEDLFKSVGVDPVEKIKSRDCIYVSGTSLAKRIEVEKAAGEVDRPRFKNFASWFAKNPGIDYCAEGKSSPVKHIGQQFYLENGDHMGIKRWATGHYGCYFASDHPRFGPVRNEPIAIYKSRDFRSNLKVDSRLLKKMNFSHDDCLAVVNRWKKDLSESGDWYQQRYARKEVKHYLKCLKMENFDGDIFIMNILFQENKKVVHRLETETPLRSVTMATDRPVEVMIDLDEIYEIQNGIVNLRGEMEYINHSVKVREQISQGDVSAYADSKALLVGDVGAYDDMLHRNGNQAHILEVISSLTYGDCAFVKRSDGTWTLAAVDEMPWGDDECFSFDISEEPCKKKEIPRKRWLSSIRLMNNMKYQEKVEKCQVESSGDETDSDG